ncbi:unnamed protein product [Phytophthora fragariaefolia]|uniref:Unnamed protein product n=1 Tax=Phytophthora fragariaefolia TaxID=1490495 RepID=A0A9W6U3Y2_9STRA|nr:unnamed protein product [Phytophthora fragariaefolia]
MVAGSAHIEEGAGVVARANKSGRFGAPTTQGVVAVSARATEDAGACALATTSGRAGAPTSKAINGDKVTSTPEGGGVQPRCGFRGVPQLAEVVILHPEGGAMEFNSPSVMDAEVLEDERTSKRQTGYGAAVLKDLSDPYHPLLKGFSDVVSDDPPSILPPDRGVRHEIDLVPGTTYCTTRQGPTFCVRNTNGKFRMVHAFNKLNAATIPASTPIPRKDVLQINMAGCTVFSPLDMADGYYQLLMRESDIPLTSVSTHSGMLWEWLVMPQGLSNAPATFNRLVTQLFRPMWHFVQTDSLFDLEKVCAIAQWPVPVSQKDLRKWLGLANYLHKYSANYADMARPLPNLLKKDAVWSWVSEAQQALKPSRGASRSLRFCLYPTRIGLTAWYAMHPTLPLAVPCYRLMARAVREGNRFPVTPIEGGGNELPCPGQGTFGDEVRSGQVSGAPVRSKTLCDLHRSCLFEDGDVVASTLLRMARWLSFFAKYNFTVEYKPGKQNVLADALSRRPEYELAHLAYLKSPLYELIREAYAGDDDLAGLVEALSVPNKTVGLTAEQRSRLHRYSVVEVVLYYQVDGGEEPQIVVPNDEDLRHRVLYETQTHNTPLSGHLGRKKRIRLWPATSAGPTCTRLDMSTADHPQTDCQTERVNGVLEDVLRSVCAAEPIKWSTPFPQVGFALNNAVHSSSGFTPFYVNGLWHPRTPLTLLSASNLGGREANVEAQRASKAYERPSNGICSRSLRQARLSDSACVTLWRLPKTLRRNRVIAKGVRTRKCFNSNAKNLLTQAVSAVGSTKLRPRFMGPFTVIGAHGHAYTLDLPSSMGTHPTFYVGMLKPYHPARDAEPAGSTAPPSTDGRCPPTPGRTVPREPGQERGSEGQPELLRGVRLASPSGPPGHTDSGSRRGASPSLGAPIRRSPRLANIGPEGGRLRHQDGLSAQATPTRGLAEGLSPGGHPGASPGESPLLGRERAAPPSQSGHPAVVDKTPNRPEGSQGQDGGQSVDAVRPGRTPLPSRAPPPLLDS